MDDKRYEGWANFETWAVNLYIRNERDVLTYWQDNAREMFETSTADEVCTKEQRQKFELSDQLEESFAESMPELDDPWATLLQAAFNRVSWGEIAEELLNDLREG